MIVPLHWQVMFYWQLTTNNWQLTTNNSPLRRLHQEKPLPELYGRAVFHEDPGDRAAAFGFDVVENFHRFDHADIGFFIDGGADGDERLGFRAWRGVEGAHHGAFDGDHAGSFIGSSALYRSPGR